MEQICISQSYGSTYNNKKTQRTPAYTLQHLSSFSVKILEIIRDNKGAANRDIIDKLGHTNTYISQYLYRLSNFGLVFRNQSDWKWYLLDPYPDFLKDLDSILYIIYNINTTLTQHQHNINTNDSVLTINNNHNNKIEKKKASVQLTLKPYNNPDYSETENKLVNLLVVSNLRLKFSSD